MRCFASKQCYITAFSVLVKFLDSLIFPEVEDKTAVVYGRVGAEWAEDQQKRKCSRRGAR